MTRPPLLVRFAGSPVGAIVLFIVYGVLVLGWYQNEVPWWLALATVGAAYRTLSAVGTVRGYKAWQAQWSAMGTPQEQTQKVEKRRGGWVLITLALLLLVGIPMSVGQRQDNGVVWLRWVWLAVALYLLFRLVRGILRRLRKGSKGDSQKKLASPTRKELPVEWMVSRASSSPSREAAQRNLPEYTTRLIRGA
jgi:cytochrome bd-type quinol oxidase subunit 2